MEKEDDLPMDQTARPELVTEPSIEEPQPTEAKEPIADERETAPRDEHGRFASKEEKGVEDNKPEPPSEQLPKDIYEPLKAVRNENKELKEQLAAIQRQLEQQKPPPAPAPEFWDDPDGAIATRVSGEVSKALQQWQQQQEIERVNHSEAAAKAKYPDYDDSFRAFEQAVKANPALAQQMMQSGDPGEFAYKTGKRAAELERVGSIDELIRSERAKWEEELKASAPKPSFPQSTVHDGTVAPRGLSLPGYTGNDPVLPMDQRK